MTEVIRSTRKIMIKIRGKWVETKGIVDDSMFCAFPGCNRRYKHSTSGRLRGGDNRFCESKHARMYREVIKNERKPKKE